MRSYAACGIKVYLVGGCVRDVLLGRTPKDWDMVTTTPRLVEALGLPQVGQSFPVWQAKAGEFTVEIAAARRERKVGVGYNGFEVELTDNLGDDLLRRDLTVNAMAWHPEEGLVWSDQTDPLADLQGRVLRHVGPAFVEDPLRVMRCARFSAQLGWDIAPETIEMMRSLNHELPHLTKERVRIELEKALMSPNPAAFFEALRLSDSLDYWFPEIKAMIGVIQPELWHPEGDVWNHTMLVISRARHHGADFVTMLAALCHDFGKPMTPPESWPKHHNHEMLGKEPIEAFVARLDLGEKVERTLKAVATQHTNLHNITKLRGTTLARLVKNLKRTMIGLEGVGLACKSDQQGRGPHFENAPYPQADILRHLGEALSQVEITPGWSVEKIEQVQAKALEVARKNYMDTHGLTISRHY